MSRSATAAKMSKPYDRLDHEDATLKNLSGYGEDFKRQNPHLFLRHRDIVRTQVNQHFNRVEGRRPCRLVKAEGKYAFSNK